MTTSHPANSNAHHNSNNLNHTPMMASHPTAGLPYNNTSNNAKPTPMLMTQLPPQPPQSYPPPPPPPARMVVSPMVSPVVPREPMMIPPISGHAVHLPNQGSGSPTNIHHKTISWQQHHAQQQQQQQQPPPLNTIRSHDGEEGEGIDVVDAISDVSSIPWGSIRPVPNYDPAKDPTNPKNMDKPFVAPSEITIRVVKGRRRKTMGCTSSVYSSQTFSTTVTPPQHSSSMVEEDTSPRQQQAFEQPEWLQSSPDPPTTQTGSTSIPMLGLINSFASDASDSNNSFAGSATVDGYEKKERLHLEADLMELQLQETQADKQHQQLPYDGIAGASSNEMEVETKHRKGMVRRQFSRRLLGRSKKKSSPTNTNSGSHEFHNDTASEDDNASGNKIIIQLDDDHHHNRANIPEPPKPPKKKLYASPFGGRIKHRRSSSMRLIVGQENGC